jgi:paraquat-inducible protein B
VRWLVDQATERQLVANLAGALEDARGAIASIGTAADGVPQLVGEVEALAGKVGDLPLDELVASATRLVDSVDAFVQGEKIASLPASLDASLAEIRSLVADLRGAPVANLNATLVSARTVVDDLAAAKLAERLDAALAGVTDAAAGVPALVDNLTAFSASARDVPLEELTASATRTLDSAEALLASEGVTDVPPRLAAALEEARAVLAELRAGGAVANVNATLASARTVADDLAAQEVASSLRAALADAAAAAANVSTASEDLAKTPPNWAKAKKSTCATFSLTQERPLKRPKEGSTTASPSSAWPLSYPPIATTPLMAAICVSVR